MRVQEVDRAPSSGDEKADCIPSGGSDEETDRAPSGNGNKENRPCRCQRKQEWLGWSRTFWPSGRSSFSTAELEAPERERLETRMTTVCGGDGRQTHHGQLSKFRPPRAMRVLLKISVFRRSILATSFCQGSAVRFGGGGE